MFDFYYNYFFLKLVIFLLFRMTTNPTESMVAAVVRVMCKTDYGETAR